MMFLKPKQKQQPTIAELESEAQQTLSPTLPHYHKDEDGILRQCYHVCGNGLNNVRKTLLSPAFWIGITVSYPFEHLLWERVPGFSHIAHFLGMH